MLKGAILRASQQRLDKGEYIHHVKKASWKGHNTRRDNALHDICYFMKYFRVATKQSCFRCQVLKAVSTYDHALTFLSCTFFKSDVQGIFWQR